MKSIEISPEAMAKRSARFEDLVPYKAQHDESNGIPTAVVEKLTAHNVYPIMVPAAYTGRSSMAPVKAGEHTVVYDASALADGMYTFSLLTGDARVTKKMRVQH